jgi:hypothetical protein
VFRNLHVNCALLWLGLCCGAASAWAGPPFLTDDPQPVEYQHNEFYIFSTTDQTPDGKQYQLPAFEYNRGILPDVQFHIVIPYVQVEPVGGSKQSGLGDIEVGIKYRFVQETDSRPQIGTFPMVQLPTGDSDKGLGNGRAWFRVPIWVQKSFGPWTTYGGMGYAYNPAPGQRDYTFYGWQVQREINKTLTLGAEIYSRGADTRDGRETSILNVGGYYNFTEEFSLLFSGGGNFTGETHSVGYLGLYWTWGAEAAQDEHHPALPGAQKMLEHG